MATLKPDVDSCSSEILCELLSSMFHEIQQRGMGESLEILNDKGLTLPQIMTLHLLQEKGPRTVTEISECTKLSAGATSHLVDRLYTKQLVDRTENEQDRRQKRISLSNLGATTMDRLQRTRKEEFTKTLETLSDTTRARFVEVLKLVLSEVKSTKADPMDTVTHSSPRATNPEVSQ
jgi:DNA-binding MarR family transcriptional regulator